MRQIKKERICKFKIEEKPKDNDIKEEVIENKQILEEPKNEINPNVNEEKKEPEQNDVKVEENKKNEEDKKEKEEKKEDSIEKENEIKKVDGDKTEDIKFKKVGTSPENNRIRKSTSKHIKIKYKRTSTSKNLSALSCTSEGSFPTKKMRIKRSIVLNPAEYPPKKLLNRSISISYNLNDLYNYYKDFSPKLKK